MLFKNMELGNLFITACGNVLVQWDHCAMSAKLFFYCHKRQKKILLREKKHHCRKLSRHLIKIRAEFLVSAITQQMCSCKTSLMDNIGWGQTT